MPTLEAGAQFAGYRIERIAGRGGMGVVYRATQLALQRPVALKLLTPQLAQDHVFRDRFKREAQVVASLDHPNVIPLFEAGDHDGTLFMTMRFVEGTDLAATIEREGRIAPEALAGIVVQVAAALDAAHARGLVHRDVKPHNVLLAGDHAYLTDFGLSRTTKSGNTITRVGELMGTVDYMAPEQLRQERADARSDVYALGCMVHHALAGSPPFNSKSDTARMLGHLKQPPPDVPGAAAPLTAVVKRAMAKDPSERFQSAGEFARAFCAALTSGETVAARDPFKHSFPRAAGVGAQEPRGGRAARRAVGIALLVVLVAGLIVAALAAAGVIGGRGDDAGAVRVVVAQSAAGSPGTAVSPLHRAPTSRRGAASRADRRSPVPRGPRR